MRRATRRPRPLRIETPHLLDYTELPLFLEGIANALLTAGVMWVIYMSAEPFIRRRWPQTIVSWTRLLAGNHRDPLVAGHVLAGTAFAMLFFAVIALGDYLKMLDGRTPTLLSSSLSGVRMGAAHLIGASLSNVLFTTGLFLLAFLLRALCRRVWLAVAAFIALFFVVDLLQARSPIEMLISAVMWGILVTIFFRGGLLIAAVSLIVYTILARTPGTLNFNTWYAGSTFFTLFVVIGLAVYSCRLTLKGQPLITRDIV